MSSIGIMDPAFFVGKNVLLKWVNDFFELSYSKVEQCCTGALHCQILDAIYPGKVPLHKVNFDAKFDYEWVNNFKILQGVFTKMEIIKHVDVEKLVKGKYQDNLEMLQWMKNFFETKFTGQEYHAAARREEASKAYKKGRVGGGGAGAGAGAGGAGTGAARPAKAAPTAAGGDEKKASRIAGSPGTGAPAAAPPKRAPAKTTAPAPAPGKRPAKVEAKSAPKPAAGRGAKAVAAEEPEEEPEPAETGGAGDADLSAQIAALQQTIEGLEKERNFYFGKLREIEILCQTEEAVEAATKQQVLKILYHTDDSDEFQSPAETTGER